MLNDVTLDLAEHLRTQMLGTRLREKWRRQAVPARKKFSHARKSYLLYWLARQGLWAH